MFEKTSKIKKNFILIIFGASLALIFAPTNWFLIGFITLPVLFLAVENSKNYFETFTNSIFFGFGFFLASNYWIAISLMIDFKTHGWLIPFALTLIPLILAFCLAISCLIYKFIIHKTNIKNKSLKIITFSLFWMFSEFLRGQVFSGFPWNLLGYSWLFNLKLSQIASIIGVHGLSFLAIITFLSPILFIKLNSKNLSFNKISNIEFGAKLYLTTITAIIIVSYIYGNIKINTTHLTQKNYNIRIVQANIKQNLKWDPQEKYHNFIDHIKLTNKSDLKNIDIVIWSESSIPYLVNNDSEFLKILKQAIPENGYLISGGLRNKNDKYWNSIFIFNKDGINSYYDKHHLVPFGEYVPLQKYLPFIDKITQGASGFESGIGPKILKINDDLKINPLICYEAIFSKYGVNDKKIKSDLLLNLTNDSWFGISSGPYQHLAMAQMRAIEFNTPMVRVSNSGISAYINPLGKIEKKITLNKKGIIDLKISTIENKTIYQKFLEMLY